MGDTIKPRLMDAHADENRIFCIDESEKSLTLLDERIEKAIDQTGARLIILDPVQGYVGERIDMNRANEIRTVMKKLAAVAERTGCAVVLVGHLNKNGGAGLCRYAFIISVNASESVLRNSFLRSSALFSSSMSQIRSPNIR